MPLFLADIEPMTSPRRGVGGAVGLWPSSGEQPTPAHLGKMGPSACGPAVHAGMKLQDLLRCMASAADRAAAPEGTPAGMYPFSSPFSQGAGCSPMLPSSSTAPATPCEVEFLMLWPPCATVGEATSVEVRMGVTFCTTCAPPPCPEDDMNSGAAPTAGGSSNSSRGISLPASASPFGPFTHAGLPAGPGSPNAAVQAASMRMQQQAAAAALAGGSHSNRSSNSSTMPNSSATTSPMFLSSAADYLGPGKKQAPAATAAASLLSLIGDTVVGVQEFKLGGKGETCARWVGWWLGGWATQPGRDPCCRQRAGRDKTMTPCPFGHAAQLDRSAAALGHVLHAHTHSQALDLLDTIVTISTSTHCTPQGACA